MYLFFNIPSNRNYGIENGQIRWPGLLQTQPKVCNRRIILSNSIVMFMSVYLLANISVINSLFNLYFYVAKRRCQYHPPFKTRDAIGYLNGTSLCLYMLLLSDFLSYRRFSAHDYFHYLSFKQY